MHASTHASMRGSAATHAFLRCAQFIPEALCSGPSLSCSADSALCLGRIQGCADSVRDIRHQRLAHSRQCSSSGSSRSRWDQGQACTHTGKYLATGPALASHTIHRGSRHAPVDCAPPSRSMTRGSAAQIMHSKPASSPDGPPLSPVYS